MHRMRLPKGFLILLLLASLGVGAYFTRETWMPWFTETQAPSAAMPPSAPGAPPQQVTLTPQAQANLQLRVQPLQATTSWRMLQIPGLIQDRPARSDRNIVAPLTGILTQVHHVPGDTVRPGVPLFTLRLLSDTLHSAQAELFKATQEFQLTQEQRQRLIDTGADKINPSRLLELDMQLRRLQAVARSYRQELQARALTVPQIDKVAQGQFLTELTIAAPVPPRPAWPPLLAAAAIAVHTYELKELKAELGQLVQAGQTLAVLSNHQALYIEGRSFRQELPLVEQAARARWPVRVEFLEEKTGEWPPLEQLFVIRHVANAMDPASRTFAFYLPLENQSRSFGTPGKQHVLWRFRPGQRVRLHLKVEKFENVFQLPADAVVWEGPEAYIFRQNGDMFDRKPVQVVYRDRQHVMLANDGSVPPGTFVVQNSALQINRALKAQGATPSGFHMHADGSIHANH